MVKLIRLINNFIEKYGIYCLGIVVIILNVSLAFDNVVWGDEAFSGNTVSETNLYGIFQRVYYWDSHPPLYYYWLRLVASIFGYKTSVYHFAALIPFSIGIVLAMTLFQKKFGKIPAAFFIVLSGLSAPCAEYNLEIRMYALVFFELLMCAYCSYRIMEAGGRKKFWVGLTIFGVLAAYTHYFGLVVSGILLFMTTVFNFLRNKKIKYGINALIMYIVLYAPWLVVFFRQAKSVGNNWWLSEIAPLNVLGTMIFCGENVKKILMPVVILFSIIVFVKESEFIYPSLPENNKAIRWILQKPSARKWSIELWGIVLFWAVIFSTLVFTYLVSVLISPLTVARYMYPLVPIQLFILMLCIRRILAYGKITWGKQSYGMVQEEDKQDRIYLVDMKSEAWKKTVFSVVSVIFMVLLTICLFDFKYYRSVSKTQEVQTQKILTIIGDPEDEAVFTATGVKHLSWTVLPYYFPGHEVHDCLPNDIDADKDDIWAFIGYAMSDEAIEDMEAKGYSMEMHMDLWFGKYGCNLYHFYR